MEQSCMTRLRLKLRYCDDVLTHLPDTWLRNASVCLGFTCLIYGFFTLAFGVMEHDNVLLVCGSLGLILFILMFCLLPCFGVVYTLWFDLAVLLLLMGATLRNVQGGVSYFFYGLGGIFMALLAIGSFLLRCNIGGDAAPNVAVAYHVPRAEDV